MGNLEKMKGGICVEIPICWWRIGAIGGEKQDAIGIQCQGFNS